MKPLMDYLQKNYEKSTTEQIADDYRERGYEVKFNVPVGKYRVDLAAIKDGRTIYVEIKSRINSPDVKKRIKEMTDYFKTIPNSKFLVAISRIPIQKTITIENIESILDYYFSLNFPSELDELSTHTQIEDIHDVSINDITICEQGILFSCNGMMGVTLQYGADSEQEIDDAPMRMSFPFKFKGMLEKTEHGFEVADCSSIEIDTDAYYG